MQVNDQVELKIEGLTSDGKGIANYHHYRIFVLNALPQERVKAKINQLGKKRAQAVSEEILEPSPVRVKDTDEEWLRKGFAPLANLKYEEQLSFKQMRVKHLLAKAGLNEVPVAPTVASPEQMHYRNEGLAPVRQVKGKLEVGFFKQPGKQFVPLHRFFSVKPEVQTALFCVRDILRQLKIPAYDPKQETGFIRGIDIWRSEARGDIMVTLIARKKDLVELPQLVGLITEKIKHFAGVVLNYNPHQTDKTFGKENIPVWGNDYIVDEINHLQFKISPRSYFEPNSQQVRRILHLLLISADLHPDDQVIDADCGGGDHWSECCQSSQRRPRY